ncbi:hypothetical protein J2Y63_002727 [Shinella sp. BE166]
MSNVLAFPTAQLITEKRVICSTKRRSTPMPYGIQIG